jgi:alcohol dehydrogenase (cytochrome c)
VQIGTPPEKAAGRICAARPGFVAGTVFAVIAVSGAIVGCDGHRPSVAPPELRRGDVWAAPNQNLGGTRAASSLQLRASTVARLRLVWRFALSGQPTFSGLFASTPLVLDDRVYVEDLNSNVYALALGSGRVLWARRYGRTDGGPNGLAAGYGRIYGSTASSAFALNPATGRQLWMRRLTTAKQPITIAPAVAAGLVYTSSTGQNRGGRGTLYALDAATGRVRWLFDTIRDPWRYPALASGGGAWYTPTVDRDATVYVGTSNPYPWGGTRRFPNGGMYPGPVPYTDSLLVLDGRSGQLLWHDQVTPHDVRDYDFQASPILTSVQVGGRKRAIVFGAGKAGIVIAWDRQTRRRLWTTRVGVHLHDVGPLPDHPARVCPGLLGGVETPMAYADGRLFVPVVDLCFRESAYATSTAQFLLTDYAKGRGELVALDAATGATLWTRRFPAPDFGCATVANDVVFTATYDGRLYALAADDGRILWRARARAGINSCPAIAAGMLIEGAAAPNPGIGREHDEIAAYALR